MLLKCQNKPKCGKDNVAVLDLATDKVHCSECGSEIANVTSFSKNALKEARQIKKADASGAGMSVKCHTCHRDNTPYLKEGVAYCGNCKSSIEVSAPFMQMLKVFGK